MTEMKIGSGISPAAESPALPEVSPRDRHNATLVANVHSPDWVNPEPQPRYNLVVTGGGTAGLVSVAGAAGLGAKVALVERHLLGGDFLNYGCVPSKAIIRSSKVYADLRDDGRFGLKVSDPGVDFAAVMERMRRLRAGISRHDSAQRLRDLGWMSSWARPGLPARIRWRWAAGPCPLKKRSSPLAAGPCTPRCQPCRKPAI